MKASLTAVLSLLLLIFLCPLSASHTNDNLNYRVTRSDYTFSTVFDLASEKHPVGSVVKSVFHTAKHYDSYDRYGLFEGQGICGLGPLGLFYSWAAEIVLYNAYGEIIGRISGQLISSEPAKFGFYDALDNQICIAYLDQNCMGFVLVDPDNSAFVLARLTRNFILDTIDNWDVSIYYPERIPSKFVKIFSAFVCDTQNNFKQDI